MSMQLLTILQMIATFMCYTCICIIPPAIIFSEKFSGHKLLTRIMAYYIIGNFFIINYVMFLELIKMSYSIVYWITIPLITIVATVKVKRLDYKKWFSLQGYKAQVLMERAVGRKTRLLNRMTKIGNIFKNGWRWCLNNVINHPVQLIMFVATFAILIYYFAPNYYTYYGFGASDMPVHLYWTNGLITNQPYIAGVYPEGYHCIMYFIYAFFGIDTYIVMRVFGFTTALWVCLALYEFGHEMFKSRFTPFLSVFIYVLFNHFTVAGKSRFFASLPQEYGMIFILPGIMFLLMFFREQQYVEPTPKMWRKWDPSKKYLVLFGMAFSLTLDAHFYITIVMGVFCIAVGAAYCLRFIKLRYFGPIMLVGFLSVAIAIAPMAIAYATGTKLQGSLYWAAGVMSGKTTEDVMIAVEGEQEEEEETDESEFRDDSATSFDPNKLIGIMQNYDGSDMEDFTYLPLSTGSQLKFLYGRYLIHTNAAISEFIANGSIPDNIFYSFADKFVIMMLVCTLGGIIYMVRDKEYGYMQITMAAYMFLLIFMLSAYRYELPMIMDGARTLIFVQYHIALFFAAFLDIVFVLVMGWFRKTDIPLQITSMAAVGAVCFYMYKNDMLVKSYDGKALEPNGAITCITNIINDNEDMTWTIVSAGDALHMVELHGFHYEILTLLNIIDYVDEYTKITLPTEKIFFFIEKYPIDYGEVWGGSGSRVSAREASYDLPGYFVTDAYHGENRWIVMSKMYYWANAFKNKYPNEMKVYYEDDEFVCYCLQQNPFSLFNMAIDYGYNRTGNIDLSKFLNGNSYTDSQVVE